MFQCKSLHEKKGSRPVKCRLLAHVKSLNGLDPDFCNIYYLLPLKCTAGNYR